MKWPALVRANIPISKEGKIQVDNIDVSNYCGLSLVITNYEASIQENIPLDFKDTPSNDLRRLIDDN